MLNFFYMYALVWGTILFFYSLRWSDLCAQIAPELLVFFVVTIVVSLLSGMVFRSFFRGKAIPVPRHRSRVPVLLIVLYCAFEFLYCRQIPLLYIIISKGGYTEYTGIPTLHPLVVCFGSFYAQYLFYRFLVDRSEKIALIDYVLILTFIYLLQFNRGGLMISAFMSALMFLGLKMDDHRKKHIGRNVLLVGVLLVLVLFAFGALGNIRHGYAVSDSSYIEKLGRFNASYPSWLPKQFMWAYIYTITPIANINFNVAMHAAQMNPMGYLMTMIPDFISRRIYSGVIYSPHLVVEHVFNATAGFGTAYMNGGIFGMYFLYAFLMFGFLLLLYLWKRLPAKREYEIPVLTIMDIIVIFMFFTHTLYYSAIGFQLFFPLLTVFGVRIKLLK